LISFGKLAATGRNQMPILKPDTERDVVYFIETHTEELKNHTYDIELDPSLISKIKEEHLQFLAQTCGHSLYPLARTVHTPSSVLGILASHPESGLRATVASNPSAPLSVLEQLAKDNDDSVRTKVAGNPSTLPTFLEKLGDDSNKVVREIVAGNPNCPPQVIQHLFNQGDFHEIISRNPNTPAAILETLTRSPQKPIRLNVCSHPNTPTVVLDELATDEDPSIRYLVAGNPNTSERALKLLSSDAYLEKTEYMPRPIVVEAVASNPKAPPELLEAVYRQHMSSVYIKPNIASNPNTPEWILRYLSEPMNNDPCREKAEANLRSRGIKVTKCFIATACFGQGNHNIVTLTQFRDVVLSRSNHGRRFIGFYYSISPKIANAISKAPLIGTGIRIILLVPLVRLIRFYFRFP
jgi:hypothetical protein